MLALAFVARAAIALSGDFVLHPDEIMQYLEPAHRLVFGNGVIYWEYFYGARSWLLPGLVAGVLALCEAVGLGQPLWYVGAVKLLFCAVSLVVPGGMYWFARRHFGEPAARVALLAGAFWYELAGFAHKPMTEFVATALLVGLLALCVRPWSSVPWRRWLTEAERESVASPEHTAAGSLVPNAFGLSTIHGNVADFYDASSAACTRRVVRGGSWGSSAQLVRSAYRSWCAPTLRKPSQRVSGRPHTHSVTARTGFSATLPLTEPCGHTCADIGT